jgi:low temperature requirement protein LtrA
VHFALILIKSNKNKKSEEKKEITHARFFYFHLPILFNLFCSYNVFLSYKLPLMKAKGNFNKFKCFFFKKRGKIILFLRINYFLIISTKFSSTISVKTK